MAGLLGRLIAAQRTGPAAAGVPLGYLARLLRAFGPEHAVPDTRPGTAAVPGIVEPLTSTSATCWTSSARPTAPRPSPGRGNWT